MHSFGAVEGCSVSNRETRIEERVSSSPNRSCFCNCARYLKDTNSLQRLTRRVCVCVCVNGHICSILILIFRWARPLQRMRTKLKKWYPSWSGEIKTPEMQELSTYHAFSRHPEVFGRLLTQVLRIICPAAGRSIESVVFESGQDFQAKMDKARIPCLPWIDKQQVNHGQCELGAAYSLLVESDESAILEQLSLIHI